MGRLARSREAAEKKTRFSGLKRTGRGSQSRQWQAAEKKTRFSGLKPFDRCLPWQLLPAAEKKTRFSGLKLKRFNPQIIELLCRREEDAL